MSARALHSILTTGPGNWLEVHALDPDAEAKDGKWIAVWCNGQPRRFERACELPDARVALVPRNNPESGDASAYAGCLWARLETGKHAEALSRFRRGPSLVLREGKSPKRWALWWLEQPLKVDVVARGNRAIAFTLGTVQKHGAEPELAFVPCPGSLMKLGRKKPMPVAVEFAAPGRRYHPRDFKGVVRKPPEVNTDWRRAA